MLVFKGDEIDEVVIEGNERVVIKLRDGHTITVMPGIRMINRVEAVWDDGKVVDVKIDEVDRELLESCMDRAFLVYTIKTVKDDSH
jgi:hypothetical protein